MLPIRDTTGREPDLIPRGPPHVREKVTTMKPACTRCASLVVACCIALAAPTLATAGAIAASMRMAWAAFAASGNLASASVPWAAFGGGNRPRVQSLVPPQPQPETDFSARHHCSFWPTR